MPLEQDARTCDLHMAPCRKGGCFAYTPWSFVSLTLFNAGLALLFLIPSLPIMLAIALIIKIKERGPILYRGPRLGACRQTFDILKFRTLPVDAESTIGAELLRPDHFKLNRFSRFLRDSRLDELPQLFNILKGEMDFIGPRPVRQAVYERIRTAVPNYEIRFSVRPGLIGYSQLFTPHSAPKQLRARIDNKFACSGRGGVRDLLLILYTVFVVVRASITKGTEYFLDFFYTEVLGLYMQKRDSVRVRQRNATVRIKTADGEILEEAASLKDVNETHLRIWSNIELGDGEHLLELRLVMRRGSHHRGKRSACVGRRVKALPHGGNYKHVYVLAFHPVSQYNNYILDKYFLRQCLILKR